MPALKMIETTVKTNKCRSSERRGCRKIHQGKRGGVGGVESCSITANALYGLELTKELKKYLSFS